MTDVRSVFPEPMPEGFSPFPVGVPLDLEAVPVANGMWHLQVRPVCFWCGTGERSEDSKFCSLACEEADRFDNMTFGED